MWSGASGYETRQTFPIVSLWSVANGLILAGVLTVAFSRRVPRAEERFFLKTHARVKTMDGRVSPVETLDVSMSGARITGKAVIDTWLTLTLPDVPPLLARVRWSGGGQTGVEFHHIYEDVRDDLIACIYTDCETTIPTENRPGNMLLGLLLTIFVKPRTGGGAIEAQRPETNRKAASWYRTELNSVEDYALWDQNSQEFARKVPEDARQSRHV